MKKLKLLLVSAVASMAVAFPIIAPMTAYAACTNPNPAVCSAQSGADASGQAGGANLPGLIKIVVDILLYVIGAIAVIMIIIGGIRYVTSGGDSGQIKSAKDTILYAVIGVVVSILAYAIVQFVLKAF